MNSVDRSNGKQLVATGDDFGNVNLYRYPCVNKKVMRSSVFNYSALRLKFSVLFVLRTSCSSSFVPVGECPSRGGVGRRFESKPDELNGVCDKKANVKESCSRKSDNCHQFSERQRALKTLQVLWKCFASLCVV